MHINIYRLFNLSRTLYFQHGIRAIPLTFWFLWTSSTFFRCPRLHLVVTIRSESLPSRPQSLQLSDLIVLLIQLPKQSHRGDRTANPEQNPTKNGQKPPHTCRLKFSSREYTLPRSSVHRHMPHTPAPSHVLPR